MGIDLTLVTFTDYGWGTSAEAMLSLARDYGLWSAVEAVAKAHGMWGTQNKMFANLPLSITDDSCTDWLPDIPHGVTLPQVRAMLRERASALEVLLAANDDAKEAQP